MPAQKFKSIDLRTIVNSALEGKPINVRSVTLFDAPDVDIDDDRDIFSPDFDDPLEVVQAQRDFFEESQLRKEVLKNEIPKNEKTENEETPSLQTE